MPLALETELARPRFLISLPTLFASSSRTTLDCLTELTGAVGAVNARAGRTERRMEAGRGREEMRLIILYRSERRKVKGVAIAGSNEC